MFDLNQTFDALVCVGSTFLYNFTNEDARLALMNFRKHLKDGGVLYLDMRNAAFFLTKEGQRWLTDELWEEAIFDGEPAIVKTRFYIDLARQVLKRDYNWKIGARDAIIEHLEHRLFFPQEIAGLLSVNSFKVIELFDKQSKEALGDMETETDQRRGLVILLVFTFFMVVGFDMIMPLVIGHYVNNIGLTATAVSVALAIRQFSQQGLAMIGGALADRFQVKTLISVGVFLRVLGFLTLAFSSAYGMLIAAMILIGLGGVLFEMPYQSAIAMLTTNDNRPKYYSLNNTITGIASAIGPLLGVALLRLDFKVVCFGAASCFMINFVYRLFTSPV